MPRAFPIDKWVIWQPDEEFDLAVRISADSQFVWQQALDGKHVANVWEIWCDDAGRYLWERSGDAVRGCRAYSGRARCWDPVQKAVAAKQGHRDIDAQVLRQRRWLRFLRRPDEVERQLLPLKGSGQRPIDLERLWMSLCKDGVELSTSLSRSLCPQLTLGSGRLFGRRVRS